jgi:hypothetical protein
MDTVIRLAVHGGMFGFLVLYLSPVAPGLGITHAVAARRWSFYVGLIAAVLPALIGGLGAITGYMRISDALPGVDPRYKAEVWEVGIAEACLPLKVGLLALGVAVVPLVIGEIRRRRGSSRAPATRRPPPR